MSLVIWGGEKRVPVSCRGGGGEGEPVAPCRRSRWISGCEVEEMTGAGRGSQSVAMGGGEERLVESRGIEEGSIQLEREV